MARFHPGRYVPHAPWLDLDGLHHGLYGPSQGGGFLFVTPHEFVEQSSQPGPTFVEPSHVELQSQSSSGFELPTALSFEPEAPVAADEHGPGAWLLGWRSHGTLDHDPGDWLL